ncbi:MAG: TIR domain-containing protein [Acidobacteriota bacterium]
MRWQPALPAGRIPCQENGVRCWFAPEDMKIGDKILERIDQTIRVHDKLLVVLSAASISRRPGSLRLQPTR